MKEIDRAEFEAWLTSKGDAVIGEGSYSEGSPVVNYLIETLGETKPLFFRAYPTSVGCFGQYYYPPEWLKNFIEWVYSIFIPITGTMCLEALNELDN